MGREQLPVYLLPSFSLHHAGTKQTPCLLGEGITQKTYREKGQLH